MGKEKPKQFKKVTENKMSNTTISTLFIFLIAFSYGFLVGWVEDIFLMFAVVTTICLFWFIEFLTKRKVGLEEVQ